MKQILIFIFVLIGIIFLFLLQVFDLSNGGKGLYQGALSLLILVLALECLFYFLFVIQEKKLLLEERKRATTGIIHDLKSPLSGIYSMLVFFLFTEKDSMRIAMLQQAKVRTKRLSETVESLLLVEEYENNIKVCSSETDLSRMLQDIVEEMKFYFNEKSINVEIDNRLCHIKVFVNTICMNNVFVNLIENTLKYSDEVVNIHISLYKLMDVVCISIKDNGWGIPREAQQKIFTPFFRAVKKPCPNGHGIGLSYSKKVVEMHGGKIDFVSVEGEGSTFTITLPLDVEKLNN